MESEDLLGRLIPKAKITGDFRSAFAAADVPDRWDEYFCFAEWEITDDKIFVRFKKYWPYSNQ